MGIWYTNSNLFLVPLDDRQGWYRFHHLFQGLLKQRLREHASTEELATLHRRASAWYAQQGLIEEALHHCLAVGDASDEARLVEAHFHRAFEQEEWVQMERWLRLLPEDEVQNSPYLLLARAWILQSHGQITDLPQPLEASERLLESTESNVHVLFAQALVFLAAGKLHQVEHIARHLLLLAQKADLAMSQYWGHWLLGTVQYEWNNLDAAVSHFSVLREELMRQEGLEP